MGSQLTQVRPIKKLLNKIASFFTSEHVDSSMTEQRRYPRILTHSLLKFSDEFQKMEDMVTNSKDISEGGVKFVADMPLPRDTVLFLKINLYELEKVVCLKGKIVWSTVVNNLGQYYHGVEFSDLSAEEQHDLHAWVYGKLSHSGPIV